MILDIRYNNGWPPEQVQNVRKVSTYFLGDAVCPALLLIFFTDNIKPTKVITLNIIDVLTVTND